jgi:hypothetical protein
MNISRVSVSLIMCAGGEYRGVLQDRRFQLPDRLISGSADGVQGKGTAKRGRKTC